MVGLEILPIAYKTRVAHMKQSVRIVLTGFIAILISYNTYATDSTRIPLERETPVKKAYLLDTGVSEFFMFHDSNRQIAGTNKVCLPGYNPLARISFVETDPNIGGNAFNDISKIVMNTWQSGYTIQANNMYAYTPGNPVDTAIQFSWTFYCMPA